MDSGLALQAPRNDEHRRSGGFPPAPYAAARSQDADRDRGRGVAGEVTWPPPSFRGVRSTSPESIRTMLGRGTHVRQRCSQNPPVDMDSGLARSRAPRMTIADNSWRTRQIARTLLSLL